MAAVEASIPTAEIEEIQNQEESVQDRVVGRDWLSKGLLYNLFHSCICSGTEW